MINANSPYFPQFLIPGLIISNNIVFYFILILLMVTPILSLILGFANIPKLKYLKGWKLTVAFVIAAILLVIFNEKIVEVDSLVGGIDLLFVAPLVLGAASILLSRGLTFIVKLTKFKAISWMLAVSLSLFSGDLSFLLFLGAYRFISGEGGLLVGILAFYEGLLVSIISLIVNIRQRKATSQNPVIMPQL